jgi:MraZ protein
MFFGEFRYKLDEKGRVAIPPRFRRELKDGIALTPGLGTERCVMAYPLAEWGKLATTLTSSVTSGKLRRLNRAIFGTAFSITIDGQGRIALPTPLREYAQLDDEIIIVGANNYLELWSKEEWDAEKAISQQHAGQIIESLERHQ